MTTHSPGHGCLSNDTSAFDAFYDFGISAAAVVLAPTPTSAPAPALVLINRS